MTGSLSTAARVTSVVAGTLVALSCGTNVSRLQFHDRLRAISLILGFKVRIFSMGTTIRRAYEALLDRKQPYCMSLAGFRSVYMGLIFITCREQRAIWACTAWEFLWDC